MSEGMLCSKTHEYVVGENNKYTIGLTDYAVEQLGDVVFVELPEVGASFAKNEVFVAFLENEKSLLEKKRDNKKATKTQVENENVKNVILETLVAIGKPATITDIQGANEELKALSNQKISALVKQLKDNGLVVKSVEKGKSLIAVAE